jgi:hypothetical protein
LCAIGMTDWVAADDDQYVEVALRSTPGQLSKIRRELPDLIGQRCSPVVYARAVEEAYRTMWEKHCGEFGVGQAATDCMAAAGRQTPCFRFLEMV